MILRTQELKRGKLNNSVEYQAFLYMLKASKTIKPQLYNGFYVTLNMAK